MNRHRIMKTGADTRVVQPGSQKLTTWAPDSVDVVDVPAANRLCRWDRDVRFREQLIVERGVPSPRIGPCVEVAQFDPQDCTLDAVHSIVEALYVVMVTAALPPIAKHSDFLCMARIAGYNDAAFAAGTEIFSRIEAEA